MTLDPAGYILVNVFSCRPFGGNPLAVFPDAAELPAELMQKLARELNLSETAFITGETGAGSHRLRIFTPRRELPFAGHPVIGAAKVLQLLGRVGEELLLELPAGLVAVHFDGDRAILTPPRPAAAVATGLTPRLAAEMLHLDPGSVKAVAGYDAGIPYNLVELRSADGVSAIRFDLAKWDEHLAGSPNTDVYAFAIEPDRTPVLVKARMFAPGDGIIEDPATGSAAAALGGYLRAGGMLGRVEVSQGAEIGRLSELGIDVRSDRIEVAGSAVYVGRGVFDGLRLADGAI